MFVFSYEYIDNSEAGTSTEMPEYSSTEEDLNETEPVQLQPFIHQVFEHISSETWTDNAVTLGDIDLLFWGI